MATIRDPLLSVEPVPEHPTRRKLKVAYELVLDADDHLVGREVGERITVHAVDEHDAAVRPTRTPIAVWAVKFTGAAGIEHRESSDVVEQTDLDVVRDWWSPGPDGEIQPIVEWSDHIAADIALSTHDRVIETVTTPTVTGSWGPLGGATKRQ